MKKYIAQGESIEGEDILIKTRKISPKNPVNDSKLGILFYYKSSKHCISEILKGISEPIRDKNSHIDPGDCLEADVIEVYSVTRLKFKKESNYSSTHGIQYSTTKQYAHCLIEIPFRIFLELGK